LTPHQDLLKRKYPAKSQQDTSLLPTIVILDFNSQNKSVPILAFEKDLSMNNIRASARYTPLTNPAPISTLSLEAIHSSANPL